jgi:acetyl-CoA carboxylase biotin carboxyl carrier protein
MSATASVQPTCSLSELTEAVRALSEIMRAGDLEKIDVSFEGVSIRLRAGRATVVRHQPALAVRPSQTPSPEPPASNNVYVISAPMIGTYYASASPGDPPFVREGERVQVGQTIGIIEAMKIMNEIAADREGTVIEIVAKNAQPVEYGSPLLRLQLDGDEE